MEKIKLFLFLYLILITTSCSDVISDAPLEPNPLEGEWSSFSDSGTLLQKKIHTPNFYTYFLIIDGEIVSNPDMKHYYIYGENQLVFDRYTQTFSIDNDTLWITNSAGNKTTKYIRQQDLIN